MLQLSLLITRMQRINITTYAPLIALILLILFSSIVSEHFLMQRNITNVLRQVSYTGIIALGMTFVIIAGGIDLSVGSMVALVGVLTIMIINGVGDGWWAVAMAMSCAVVLGYSFSCVDLFIACYCVPYLIKAQRVWPSCVCRWF